MEFHSRSFREACAGLGINIINHPVCEPRYKGAVERFFKTINQSLISNIEGRTFSNVEEKGDYDYVAKACLTFHDFQAIFYKWLVDVYSRDFHRGIEAVPVELWLEGVKKFPIDLPQKPQDLLALISQTHRRKLTACGVEIYNTFYNSEELNQVFRSLTGPEKVVVKVDPTDLGRVFVFDQANEKYLTVPCIDSDLVGLSEWQHKIIRKLVSTRRREAGKNYDTAQAKQEILNSIEKGKRHKKSRGSPRAARFAEYRGAENSSAPSDKPNCKNGEPSDASKEDLEQLIKEARRKGWITDEGEGQ